MDHFRAAAETQNRLDSGGQAASDFLGILGVIGAQAAADFRSVETADNDRVATRKVALDADDAGRQQALAAAERRDSAGVDHQRALGLERPGNPLLARRHRIRRREKPCAARSLGDRAQRMIAAARGDDHVGAGIAGDPRRFDLGLHAAARQF